MVICDRCGCDWNIGEITLINVSGLSQSSDSSYSVCPDCWSLFFEILNNKGNLVNKNER